MAEPPPNVRLNLLSTPENVVLVREMLTGVAETILLEGSHLNDIRTAVTEACNNVVLHAYEGKPGPLDVELNTSNNAVQVLVRDHGGGIDAKSARQDLTSVGIGLHVIGTLTRTVEFKDVTGGGTEVRMEFATPRITALGPPTEHDLDLSTLAFVGAPSTTTVSIAPFGLARTVLPRIVIALAARAHFSTDRISDAQLLADALVAHAQGAINGEHLRIAISVKPRDLELRIGPLGPGRAQGLIGDSEVDGLGKLIEKLADRHRVAAAGPYETLTLGLNDPR
jgi:serine/threonine-protein kinase RsbW